MKVIKPQKLGVLTRCFEHERRFQFAVSALLYIPLSAQPDLWSEIGMWKFAAEELGKDAALETGMPKRFAEYIVQGHAYPPGGKAAPNCAVRTKLGVREKILFAFGDRRWENDHATMPAPFTCMPIGWDRAFGGEGNPANPVGKGAVAVQHDGIVTRHLPNIESPQQRVTRIGADVVPAGFGVIDQSWSPRARYVGTYDEAWLKNDFPAPARDLDWRFFNLAPEDQWFSEPLRGDEPYELENLHPQQRILKGKLPGFRTRCFVTQRVQAVEQFQELDLSLKTVWLFPHAERCILIYQGLCAISEQDGEDIVHLMLAAEHASDAKPVEHYREVLKKRLDPEQGILHAMRESDLLPAGLSTVDPALASDAALTEGRDLLRTNLKKKALREIEKARAVVASHGLDPDEHGPTIPPPEEPLPDLEHLPEYMTRVLAQADAQRKQQEAQAAQKMSQAEELFKTLGMDFDMVRREQSDRPVGPPKFRAQDQFDSMGALAAMLKSRGVATDEIDGYLADAKFRNQLIEGERKLKDAYRLSAHLQDSAAPMPPEQAKSVREQVLQAYRGKQSLAGRDLTGADLSGLGLAGANFEGAFLEKVNFEGADLSHCNFRNAVLARARLARTNLLGCCCADANLGAIECDETCFDRADFSGAILRKASLRRARFQGAILSGVDCSQIVVAETDFSGIIASELILIEADLSGLVLKGAQLQRTTFLKCRLDRADFSGAALDEATFLEATGTQTNFKGADLRNARFVAACNFEGADFSDANMMHANLRGTRLLRASFIHTALDGADLSECDLREAHFYRAVAKDTRFVKADLRQAVFVSANLMQAILQRANVLGADFRGANLFRADFARVHVDQTSQFAGALMRRAQTYPRLNPTP